MNIHRKNTKGKQAWNCKRASRNVKWAKLKAEMGQTESQKGKRTQQTRKGETSSLSSPCDYAL